MNGCVVDGVFKTGLFVYQHMFTFSKIDKLSIPVLLASQRMPHKTDNIKVIRATFNYR